MAEESVEEFTYKEWKKRQEELEEKLDNNDPVHQAINHLAYGIRLNHKLIEESNKGITRKDVKLWLMIVSSVLIPVIPILLELL